MLYIVINQKTILNDCGRFVRLTLFPLKFNYVELSKRDFYMNGFSLSVTEAMNCGQRRDTCYETPVWLSLL
jgi:hypothetical protein